MYRWGKNADINYSQSIEDSDFIFRIPEVNINTHIKKKSKAIGSVEAEISLSPFSRFILNTYMYR